MAAFHVVSTPIGNLEDMTLRAIRVLREASRVMAEDTRRTAILLRHYDINTPLISAHEHNEAARAAQLISWLDAGENIAFVTDAGTPLLSDPGARLVRAVIDAGHEVIPVPGPSALLAALVVAGLPADTFTFHGFIPRSGRARSEVLAELAASPRTSVIFESPARLVPLLRDLVTACGGDRPVAVARELTKLHESTVRGTLTEVLRTHADSTVRGEIVVILGGSPGPVAADEAEAAELATRLLAEGATPRSAARELAQRLHIPRNEAYSLVVAISERGREKE